jgi:hypothetical protein
LRQSLLRDESDPKAADRISSGGEGFAARRVDAMHTWLKIELDRVPGRSRLADAIGYSPRRWEPLSRFLADSRIDLGNNPVERAIR